MKEKIKDYISNTVINVVTHSGVCHADDLFTVALLKWAAKKYNAVIHVIRTRIEEEVPENSIVVDVFNGELDHHNNDGPVDGRKLAAFGLTWRKFKKEFKELFELDEESWISIDQALIKYIDNTDNTGDMNPLSYLLNSYVSTYESKEMDDAFNDLMLVCYHFLEVILLKERKLTEDRKILNSLPTIEINGKVFAVKNEIGYLATANTHPKLNGIIIHRGDNLPEGDWMIKCFTGTVLSKAGIRNESDVIFTHPNGFLGKAKTYEAILSII